MLDGTDDFSIILIMPLKKTRQGLGPLMDTWIEVDLVLFSHSVMVYFANSVRQKSKSNALLFGAKIHIHYFLLKTKLRRKFIPFFDESFLVSPLAVTIGNEWNWKNWEFFLDSKMMIWQMSRHVPRGQDGRVALVFSLGLSRFQSNERVIQTSWLVKRQTRYRPLHNYF
mgnify:FL=1